MRRFEENLEKPAATAGAQAAQLRQDFAQEVEELRIESQEALELQKLQHQEHFSDEIS